MIGIELVKVKSTFTLVTINQLYPRKSELIYEAAYVKFSQTSYLPLPRLGQTSFWHQLTRGTGLHSHDQT